ncbi:short-chain dehydrogenase/reductase family 16C member 6-like isoform X2 [Ischnura elegans]|uniref:short-chain dehydrogenase/reductase family 16C member 6-like isoform X2 n=1 Tax=Ischnura elegans TaxID=197161 RepID=UPI001ED8A71E|nr:short-chain dehydrogenase/reductase family 16C member 6-like isoform X2 [Ischnura elegans]
MLVVTELLKGLLEVVVFLVLCAYYTIEASIRFLVPVKLRAKSIAGEVALITGGGSGIGRLLAVQLAARGATVVVLDINQAGAEETANIIKSSGGRAFSFKCDIANREDIYQTAKKVKEEVGTVRILINNAGIVSGKNLLDTPDIMVQRTFDVNVLAHFWTAKAFLPDMINDNHGHIVTIASLAGLVGVNQLADYCSSKFAVVGFDEAIRLELEVSGITGVHTTVVCPYYINTGMFEGVKSRLIPILEPAYVVDKIVSAILTNDKYLIIPSYLKIFIALKFILPPQALVYAAKNIFLVTESMSTFQGRTGRKKGD